LLQFYKNFYLYSLYFTNYKLQILSTNKKSLNNSLIYVLSSQFFLINKINSLDLTFTNVSCLDISTYSAKFFINYYVYNNYFNYFSYTFFLKNVNWVDSISIFFKNTVFLERENAEMFYIKFRSITDTRNLLLDYTNNEKPLLKSFNVEGFHEIYLNIFTNTLELININYVEL